MWTLESLKEYFQALHVERDVRYRERFEAQNTALTAALAAMNERVKLLNELREGVATKEQLEALEKVVLLIRDSVAELTSRLNQMSARQGGVGMTMRTMGLGLGALGTLITIIGAIIIIVD